MSTRGKCPQTAMMTGTWKITATPKDVAQADVGQRRPQPSLRSQMSYARSTELKPSYCRISEAPSPTQDPTKPTRLQPCSPPRRRTITNFNPSHHHLRARSRTRTPRAVSPDRGRTTGRGLVASAATPSPIAEQTSARARTPTHPSAIFAYRMDTQFLRAPTCKRNNAPTVDGGAMIPAIASATSQKRTKASYSVAATKYQTMAR